MMKKIKGLVLTLLLLLPFIGGLGATLQADAQTENVDLILHKRIIRDINQNEIRYNNKGLELENEDFDVVTGPTPLNGAEFSVYDMTDFFYEEIAKPNTNAESLIKEYSTRSKASELIVSEKIQMVETVTTSGEGDARGTARLSVPRMKDDNYAVYLIFENDIDNPQAEFNIDLEKIAMPIIVMLPIMHPDNETEELNEIHIYPKNIGYLRDPYFFKYGKENAQSPELGVPLEGAIFVLYQIVNDQKLYLDLSPASDLQNSWVVPEGDPLSDPRISKFISDEDGVVTTGGRLLPSGEYFFEEVQSVEGYQIEKESIPVVVPDSWEDGNGNPLYVTVNGQQMDELENGEVPASAYAKVEPRVYNYQTPTDPPVTPEEPTSPGQPSKPGFKLPQTGEAKMAISLLGVLLIILVAYIWKKRQKAE
ncbi:pilin N-terminal domain-containing protein [Enterococcus mediterraneensis]|uniref:pilin N-terminal domain-containing protein n=1 Tax=Enterococcus mediterraneensis TaxID=2364791 RepID=UPI001F14F793|nr:pilin N-terminal domain-containing protein [Enterococcus mediterraneensis]